MTYSLLEINRTTTEIRSTLNSILRDKRIAFEGIIIRDIRALLNSNEAILKLEEKQNILNKLTSTRYKRDKQRFINATSALQQSTSSAPMGIGTATNVLFTAANETGKAYYDNAEQKQLEKAAKDNLEAAKFKIYTPQSDNYTLIAKSVARELSFSLQPLLLVLAAGENGIVKLARFTKKSRKKYAIETLPEYHSKNSVDEIVKALVDASIPPATDDAFYRDFFKINLHKVQLGKHTTLEYDQHVNNLLKLAGLDAEMFFGQLKTKEYTIIGGFNHAVFIGQDGQLHAGIETSHRKDEILTGKLKYPIRLIAPGKSLDNTGVSFIPRPTGIYLEKAHIELLKKLFPDFSDPNATKVSNEELITEQVILPDYSKRKYHSERNSVPWHPKRTIDKEKRLKAVLAASNNPAAVDEIISTPDYDKTKSMRDAGDIFDLNYTKNDALYGEAETQKVQLMSFGMFDKLNQKKQLLASAKYSAFLAQTTSYYVDRIINCKSSSWEDLKLARQLLDTSRTSLNLSRDFPLTESIRLRKVKYTVTNAIKQESDGAKLQLSYYKYLQIFLLNFQNDLIDNDFYHNLQRLMAWKKKIISNKINILCDELNNITSFTQVLTDNCLILTDRPIQDEATAMENFEQAALDVLVRLYTININDNIEDILKTIETCVLEIKLMHYEIVTILENPELRPNNYKELITDAASALSSANQRLINAKNIIDKRSWSQKHFNDTQTRDRLIIEFEATKQQRNTCENTLLKIKLELNDNEIDRETKTFLSRAIAYKKYGKLLFLTSHKQNDEYLIQSIDNLKQSLRLLYRAIEQEMRETITTYQTNIEKYQQVDANAPIEELFAYYNELKSIKGKIELSISNDVEILSRAKIQTQGVVVELESLIKEIFAANESILTVVNEYESKLFDSSVTLTENHIKQIEALKNLLIINENQKPEKTSNFFIFIQQIINGIEKINDEIAENIEESPYKQSPLKPSLDESIKNKSPTSISIKLLDNLLKKQTITLSDVNIYTTKQDTPTPKSFNNLDEKYSYGTSNNNWQIWIIAKLLHLSIQQIIDSLNKKLNDSQNARKSIQKYVDEEPIKLDNIKQEKFKSIQKKVYTEPSELTKAQISAVRKIKQSYQIITIAQSKKFKLTENKYSNKISPNILVYGNQSWSIRPTFEELIYLNDRQEFLQEERLKKQQLYKNNTYTIDPILLRHINIAIECQKRQYETLNKLNKEIKSNIAQIYCLKPPTDKPNLDKTLQNIDKRFSKLEKIVEAKLKFIKEKIQPLEKYKNHLTAKVLRVYFTYLQLGVGILKSEHDETSIKVEQNKNITNKPKDKSIKDNVTKNIIQTISEEDILKSAKKYTIFDLEEEYTRLSNELRKIVDTNYSKSSNPPDNSSDQSYERFYSSSRSLKTPSDPKINITMSGANSNSYRSLCIFNTPSSTPPPNNKPQITAIKTTKIT